VTVADCAGTITTSITGIEDRQTFRQVRRPIGARGTDLAAHSVDKLLGRRGGVQRLTRKSFAWDIPWIPAIVAILVITRLSVIHAGSLQGFGRAGLRSGTSVGDRTRRRTAGLRK
jgi:hypothetical protein